MALTLFFLEPYSFLVAGAAGVIVYLVLLWLTKAISREEVASLFQAKGVSSSEPLEPLSP